MMGYKELILAKARYAALVFDLVVVADLGMVVLVVVAVLGVRLP
jgi:hypothetical protein